MRTGHHSNHTSIGACGSRWKLLPGGLLQGPELHKAAQVLFDNSIKPLLVRMTAAKLL